MARKSLDSVESDLKSEGWQPDSPTLFTLQKALAESHAHSDTVYKSAGSDDPDYIGLPCLRKFFRSDHEWCVLGSPFHWLGIVLKLLGVLCWQYPFARPEDMTGTVRLRHALGLTYMSIWHIGIWTSFILQLWHSISSLPTFVGMESVGNSIDRFWATVRGVLLLTAALSHLASVRFFASGAFVDLAQYASRYVFIRSWSASARRAAFILVAPMLVIGVMATLKDGLVGGAGLVAAAWMPLTVQYHLFLTAVEFCSLGLDAFALDLLNTAGLQGLVARFDKLYAAMRRSAYHVQAGLTVFATAIFAMLFATVYHLLFASRDAAAGGADGRSAASDENGSGNATVSATLTKAGDLAAVASVAALALLGLHLLNQIATVNAKCRRLPSLIQSLNFGAEIDHDKWCVAEHIASLEAGFFIHNVPVTRLSVLKFGYSALAATSFLLTRLVFAQPST